MPAIVLWFLAFLAAALAVAGVYSFVADLFLRDRSRLGRRVDEEFRNKQRDRLRKGTLFKNLPQLAAEAVADEADLSWRRRYELLVEQSGLDTTPGRVLGISAGLALFLGTLATLLQSSALAGLLVALVAAPVPTLYVWVRRRRRLRKLQAQLPEAFDLMARVIRAGQTMAQALQAVAEDFEKPISAEFSYCYEQQNLGLPPEVALRDLAKRTGILEVKIFVLALLIQQQTGGNLAELLDKLSAVMRDRFRIQGKIRTLTAEGRFQALVLLGLPPLLLLALLVINPGYGQVLLEHPWLLAALFVSELIGALWIRKIVNFDF
jgi:tight adherence protein B